MRKLLFSLLAMLSLAALPLAVAGEPAPVTTTEPKKELDWPTDGKDVDWPTLRAVPRVPAQITIMSGKGTESGKIGTWVQGLIKEKEKKAKVEITILKRKLQEEQDAFVAQEREAQRRQKKYDDSLGIPSKQRDNKKTSLRMKLDFQVPEIETYRRVVEILQARQALIADIVELLPRLDVDGDGKLTGDEYRDAGSLWAANAKLFKAIDADNDGYLSNEEIDTAADMRESASASLSAGRDLADAKEFKIKGFDENKDGTLTVAERKALTMAFVEVSLRSEQEAAFYRKLSDDLSVARQIIAAKFSELQLDQ